MIKIVTSALSLMCLLAVFGTAPATGADDTSEVLVEVNGEPITTADLERLIVESHQGGSMKVEDADGLIPKLLGRAIKDKLILQDAYAMGIAEESAVVMPVRRENSRRRLGRLLGSDYQSPPPLY